MEVHIPLIRGNLEGEGPAPLQMETLCSHLQCKNGWTVGDAVWVVGLDGPKESWIGWGSRSPKGKGHFGGKEALIVKYRDFLPWAVRRRLNRSICRLGCGLRWAKGCRSSIVFARWRQYVLMGGHIGSLMGCHIGATWRIQLNCLSAAAMRPYVKLPWPFVKYVTRGILSGSCIEFLRLRLWFSFDLTLSRGHENIV